MGDERRNEGSVRYKVELSAAPMRKVLIIWPNLALKSLSDSLRKRDSPLGAEGSRNGGGVDWMKVVERGLLI